MIALLALGDHFPAHLCTAQEITVAAAADLQFAMQDVAARFQKQTGKTVKVIYGSSGNFFQQIQNGAPFDMFFSANLDYPKKLEAAGLTVAGQLLPVCKGQDRDLGSERLETRSDSGLQALLDPSIKKIAIANPQHAPYGQAAVAAMQKRERLRKSERQVCARRKHFSDGFVCCLRRSGCRHRRAVARPVSDMKDKGRYVEIPADEYPPIEQACVILGSSKNKETARQFWRSSDGGQRRRATQLWFRHSSEVILR